MIKSMTGYGQAIKEFERYTVKIDLRSLNGKNLDINLRIPKELYHKEFVLRNVLAKNLERGSIVAYVNLEYKAENYLGKKINAGLAISYLQELKQIAEAAHLPSENILPNLLQLPDVLKSSNEEMGEGDFSNIMQTLDEAIKQFQNFRLQEGNSIEKAIVGYTENIQNQLKIIEAEDPKRLEAVKLRIAKDMEDLSDKTKFDANRFEQELIYYIEKMDISEEKIRLKNHIEYFLSTIKESGNGRKLGFITQEMGREINTIGSKANHVGMQQAVVLMKDELEKIKEQCLNVL